MRIRCEPPVLDSVVAHAREAVPNEACGLLEARPDRGGWTVVRAIRCPNLAAAPRHQFQLDPLAFLAAENQARARGNRVIALYHSHPRGPGCLSDTDREQAWPELVQVLCDLSDPENPRIRVWGREEGDLVEQVDFATRS